MLSFRKIAAWIANISALGSIFAGVNVYGSSMLPVSDYAQNVYPCNVVGQISSPDGQFATGVLVADRVVLTSASVFYDYLSTTEEPQLTWTAIAGSTNEGEAVTTTHLEIYPGYDTAAEFEGSASINAMQRDLMLLVFDEAIDDGVTAVLNVQNLSEPAYRKIVGYPYDRYLPGNSQRQVMHVTGAGEAVFANFGNVGGRIYHTGDLKSGRGAEGAPVFSYYDGLWSVDGIVVGYDVVNGGSLIVEFNTNVADFITNVINENEALVLAPDPETIIQDFNVLHAGASELKLGYGQWCSIAPDGDSDFHVLTVQEAGNYSIKSFGDFDVAGVLYNSILQNITDDDDSEGSVNYHIQVWLEPGTYYVKTTPFSTEVAGVYGLSFVSDDIIETNADDGFGESAIMNLGLDAVDLAYRIATSGQQDVFQVTISTPGHFVLWTTGDLDVKATLFQSNRFNVETTAAIATEDDAPGMGSNALLDAFLPVGTYRVVIEARNSGEFGPYRLYTHFNGSSLISFPADDNNGSFAAATPMTPGTRVESDIEIDSEMDFYRIDLAQASPLQLTITGEAPIAYLLYDSTYNLVSGSEVEDYTYSLDEQLGAGHYYLIVTSDEETLYTIE